MVGKTRLISVVPTLESFGRRSWLKMRLQSRADKIVPPPSAHGGVIKVCLEHPISVNILTIMKVANVNGTVYIYGGQATTESGQTENTWSK